MIIAIAMFIDSDMGILQPQLAVASQRIGTTQVDLAITNRFDFGAQQGNSHLKSALDIIIMISLPIDRDNPERFVLRWSLDLLVFPQWPFCHTNTVLLFRWLDAARYPLTSYYRRRLLYLKEVSLSYNIRGVESRENERCYPS